MQFNDFTAECTVMFIMLANLIEYYSIEYTLHILNSKINNTLILIQFGLGWFPFRPAGFGPLLSPTKLFLKALIQISQLTSTHDCRVTLQINKKKN